MSRSSRLALVGLAFVLLLAPVGAFHPVVVHLYAAGLSNLSMELAHPMVSGFLVIAGVSLVPAAGFGLVMVQAIRGASHLRTLGRNSERVHLDNFSYRVFPTDVVAVFTAGLIRPTTFVSTAAERALGPAELRAALLHEQAHQRRQDVMWRLLLRAIGRGFAFVPWISDLVESETLRTECAADDYAIHGGARRLDLFDAIVAASTPVSRLGSVGLTDSNVELRLLRLVHPETPLPSRAARRFVVLAAAVALPAVAVHVIAIAAAAGNPHLTM